MLGIEPLHGHRFTAEEDAPGGEKVALLSHRLWRGRFYGEDVLGRTIHLEAEPYTVIGVLPPRLSTFLPDADVVLPLGQAPTVPLRGLVNLTVLGRLAEGVSEEAARADMAAIGRQLYLLGTRRSDGWAKCIKPIGKSNRKKLNPALDTCLALSYHS